MTSSRSLPVIAILLFATASASAQRASAVVTVESVELPDTARASRTFAGAVERVGRTTDGSGWFEIVVSGAAGPAARTFLSYGITRASQLPFAVGDVLDATVDCSASGHHRVCSAVVQRASAIVLVVSANGASLGGWSHTPGERARDAPPSRETSLVLHRDGCPPAETRLGRARTVRCDDGTYIITGTARTPLDSSIPDSSAYTWFAVSRRR